MSSLRLRCQCAGRRAESLVARWGLNSLPIDPFAIARDHDILVCEKPSDEPGISGFLMKVGDAFAIGFAKHIRNEGRIRFSVSHELGHYFLPGHPEHLFAHGNEVHASRSGFVSKDPVELEADHFASSLLMPGLLYAPAMEEAGEGFEAIESLSALCKTSLAATAIRYANHAEFPVVVVVSEADRMDYCFPSDSIKDIPDVKWLGKGSILSRDTETYRFNQSRENIERGRKAEAWTTLDLWFDGAPELEMKEDIVGLGGYGKTLTVLFADELPDVEDEEEDR